MDLERYFELRKLLYAWKAHLAENLRRKAEASPLALRRLRALFDQEGASDAFSDWLSLWCRQAAIQWILRLLFLRVLEDRNLLGPTRIRTGDGQRMWSQLTRNLGAASYLLWCCRDAAHLLPDLFGPSEFDFLLPDDALMQRFFDDVWRRPDSNRDGWLRFDFRSDPAKADEGFQTRFIGDLYQELDSEIRERHALLQTPHFIAQFLLEHTLVKRFEEKDFRTVTLIDPTCGSGHILVDAFWLFVKQYEQALGRSGAQLTVQERSSIARRIVEEHIFGCDINPYASALSRFRLILAVCDYSRPASLQDLRDLHLNIVTIDSLIPYEKIVKQGVWGGEQTARIFGHPDDIQRALPVLKRRYDVVVGNPPYISVTNNSKSKIYRQYFLSASGKFGLSAPFTERFIQLCADNGAIGLINSNAFSKRQFGAPLINSVLPQYNLWSVIDLGGAYIPGHGTPTLILFIQKQPPKSEFVKVVSNIKGEPGIPTDPSNGLVWRDILNNFHKENYLGEYIAIGPLPRQEISKYPWNFKVIERRIMVLMQSHSDKTIAEISSLLGTSVITGADDIFVIESDFSRRLKFSPSYLKSYAFGSDVRDWAVIPSYRLILPYNEENLHPLDITSLPELLNYLLPFQKLLSSRTSLSGESKWFELCRMKYTAHEDKRAIFAVLIASHNHFSYNTKGTLPQQGVPAIKLSEESSDDYLATTAILNTGVVNFFLKQICFNKGAGKDPIRDRYVYAGTFSGMVPIPRSYEASSVIANKLLSTAQEITNLAESMASIVSYKLFEKDGESYFSWNCVLDGYVASHPKLPSSFTSTPELQGSLQMLITLSQDIRARMIFLQEEMDWLAYEMYGLIDKAPLAEDYLSEADYKTARLELGQRPFELAGKGYQGDWLPAYQPVPLQDFLRPLSEARMALIQSNPDIALLEDPLYKRRWIPSDYEQEFQQAAAWWLAEKLEYALEQYGKPVSLREWARLLGADARINAVMEVLTGSPSFDLESELLKVIKANAVPNRPEHTFKISGLRKYLNRPKDGDGLPAEFESKDFMDAVTWRLRGKLNIPRERFIVYSEFDYNWRGESIPNSGAPWFGWAGWTPLQRADALAALLDRANDAGWEINFRQCGLRAALRDLLPALKELPPNERSEFEAIAAGCGIGLEARCYCQAFQQAYKQGDPCAPGLSPEMLGLKPIDVESDQPRRSRRKGPEKPDQLVFDL